MWWTSAGRTVEDAWADHGISLVQTEGSKDHPCQCIASATGCSRRRPRWWWVEDCSQASPRSPAARRATARRRSPRPTRSRQHRRVRVREPRQARHGHHRRQLDPVRGARRRPELLPVRRPTPATTSTSTTTATPRPTSLPLDVHEHLQARRTRSCTTRARSRRSTTRTCNFRQTYDLWRSRTVSGSRLLTNAPVAPSQVGAASMPDYTTPARPGAPRVRRSGPSELRRPGRRPVLPRPARVRPPVRRRTCQRGRARHAGRVTT